MIEGERVRRVHFVDGRLYDEFKRLQYGRFEERQLAESISQAIAQLKENPFFGVRIPRKQWPKEYIQKFGVNNLQKIDLSGAWRLVYTVVGNEIEILSILLEWFPHKEYEKRFNYRVG